ncbi:MAG: sensor histidine kinase [Lachnospiraceae bacterium]
MPDKVIRRIQFILLAINMIAILFVTIFIYITTMKVCNEYIARDFLETITTIPWMPQRNIEIVLILLASLIISFVMREYLYIEKILITYVTLIIDFVISMTIVVLLDFNYNGILLWVFANAILHIQELKGKYIFIFLAVASYIGTNWELEAINHNLYSISNYMNYYEANIQQYLLGGFNVLLSINMIIFATFCAYVILMQRGRIEEVNQLYERLSETNNELQEANVELQKYMVIKEKMGETKERNRLAREIHDTLGHTLTGISAGIDACLATIDTKPDRTKQQLELISQVTRDGIKDVRRSVNELRPDALERLSLEHAINKMVAEVNTMTGTNVCFDCKVENLKFDEDEENTIYRVVQESITNAIRHGQAKQVWITIEKEYSDIHIVIQDNGIGCEKIKKGFGTRHMLERITMLNGRVSFDGQDGFVVDVTIPIRWGEEYD